MLESLVGDAGVAGIAVTSAPGAAVERAWLPAAAEEPRFLAYSITKTVIAALVLLLREDGRLALDDRLERWCPDVEGSRRITVRHLLDHTAGIPDYGSLRSYRDAVRLTPSEPWSFERFAAETIGRGMRSAPGTGWSYSNPGYMLLKRIAEDAAGTTFARLVAERIAEPLDLPRTAVAGSVGDLAPLPPASSVAVSPTGAAVDIRDRYHPGWVSHGVVASTPSEIARFFDALFAGRIVPPRAVAEMKVLVPITARPPDDPDPPPPAPWREPGYGLGLMGDPASPFGPIWGHGGGGPGYTASAFHAPALGGVTVCAMAAAGDDFSAEDVVFAVLRAVAEQPGRRS